MHYEKIANDDAHRSMSKNNKGDDEKLGKSIVVMLQQKNNNLTVKKLPLTGVYRCNHPSAIHDV